MALPKYEQPHFNTILPLSKMNVNYRPYLMKEQKMILIAMDGEDDDDIITSVTQIISNCTEGTVDARKLNAVDIGFLMAKIRSASEGGLVDVNMRCRNIVKIKDEDGNETEEEKECGHGTEMSVDLESMELVGDLDEERSKIEIVSGIGIKLKVPGIDMLEILSGKRESMIDALPILIDYIYDNEGGIYKLENESKAEIERFIDNLSKKNIDDITKYFNEMPRLVIKIPFTCEKCGHSEVVMIEDIQSFLD